MDIATRVNIWLCIFSFLLAVISIVTVIITLRQNNKMIEASTRPIVSVYTQVINSGNPILYLVIKNFGQSVAYMKKFDYGIELVGCYKVSSEKDYLKELAYTVLAPWQSRVCMLDLHKIPEKVKFDIEYRSETGKTYCSQFVVDLKAGTGLPTAKMGGHGDEMHTISYTLQEMLQKSL